MTKASDNQFPKVTFLESSAPSTPASTLGFLYEKTDGKIYFKNDAGTEYDLTGAAASNLQAAKYTRTSANYTTTSTSFADVDATNLALTITTGARRVMVGLVGTVSNSGTNTNMFEIDLDAGTKLSGGATFGLWQVRTPVAGYRSPANFVYLTDALTAASHTFKLQWMVNTGTATLYGTSSGDGVLTFWVQEVYG